MYKPFLPDIHLVKDYKDVVSKILGSVRFLTRNCKSPRVWKKQGEPDHFLKNGCNLTGWVVFRQKYQKQIYSRNDPPQTPTQSVGVFVF